MALVVQKYGGTSVAGTERIKRVAERVLATRRTGCEVVVVVSAMGDTTDELLDLAGKVSDIPPARELDALLASGECVSSALLAMAIEALGGRARSLTGWQAEVITTPVHGQAKIVEVDPSRIRRSLDQGCIPVIAGFQGRSRQGDEITTLGRGGSDATAVALAVALDADSCEIYTDVEGVLTADPRVVPHARRLDRLSYEEMLELSASGAKVLMSRCVEYARRHGVPVHVRPSYSPSSGTTVTGSVEDHTMEQPLITGIAHGRSAAKVEVLGVPDYPRVTEVFRTIADTGHEIDMVTLHTSDAPHGRTDIAMALPREGARAVATALRDRRVALGFAEVRCNERMGTVSLVGAGVRSDPTVAATFCEALSRHGVGIEIISTSQLRLSVLCPEHAVEDAVRALHDAFNLADQGSTVTNPSSSGGSTVTKPARPDRTAKNSDAQDRTATKRAKQRLTANEHSAQGVSAEGGGAQGRADANHGAGGHAVAEREARAAWGRAGGERGLAEGAVVEDPVVLAGVPGPRVAGDALVVDGLGAQQ